jgi:hypothetical protein
MFMGGGGAGRVGAISRKLVAGGLGAGRFGIIKAGKGPGRRAPGAIGGDPTGIGGGARGFSKLPSWFCGNRGLAGGEMTPAIGEYCVDVATRLGDVGERKLLLLL